MILLAVDPGRVTGFARFVDGMLVAAWHKYPPFTELSVSADMAIIEKPRAYPDAPVNPNDLLKLQERASEIAGLLLAKGTRVKYVYPREWKGNMPKVVCHR